MSDLVHKAKPGGTRISALCGRYGFVSAVWKRVNCEACLARRKSGT